MVVAADGDLAVQNVLGQCVRFHGVAYTVACGLGFLAVRLFAGLAVLCGGLIVWLGSVGGIGRLGDRRVAGQINVRADRLRRLQREDQRDRRGDHNGCAADDPRQRRFFLCGLRGAVLRALRALVFERNGT